MKTGFYKLKYFKLMKRISFKLPFIGRVCIDFRKEEYTQAGKKMIKGLSFGKINNIRGFKVWESKK